MKRVVVLGTSKSIMGRNGYLRVLGARYEVINLSAGRSPAQRHILALLAHHDIIASVDLLILEHYVNDISFYANAFREAGRFDAYLAHLERFYRMVAAHDAPVLNLFFPLQPRAFALPRPVGGQIETQPYRRLTAADVMGVDSGKGRDRITRNSVMAVSGF